MKNKDKQIGFTFLRSKKANPTLKLFLPDAKNSVGFTLIELLVVTAVIGVLAIVSATTFNTILRSQNKTTIINEVRQNGNSLIDRFERDVRSANTIEFDNSTNILTISRSDSGESIWHCINNQIERNGQNILSQSNLSGVQLESGSCNFEVVGTGPQIVNFSFTLMQRNPNATTESQTSVNFETSVSTRAYQ